MRRLRGILGVFVTLCLIGATSGATRALHEAAAHRAVDIVLANSTAVASSDAPPRGASEPHERDRHDCGTCVALTAIACGTTPAGDAWTPRIAASDARAAPSTLGDPTTRHFAGLPAAPACGPPVA